MTARIEQPVVNALSFDIEDRFHLVEIKAVSDPACWPQLGSLVVQYTRWILDTIEEADVRATFFVLGWIAERYPWLVRTIAEAGHELAIHSYWHRRVDHLSVSEFREDVRRNMEIVEQLSGRKVLGFRAPSFSITPGAEWAMDVLLDLGLAYDASLFPAPRGHGGYPCRQEPHDFIAPSGRVIAELPMSVLKLGPMKLPFSGGGYLRLLPGWVIRRGFSRFHQRGLPVIVYVHPRDFAPEQERIPMPLYRRFKCYVGLNTAQAKMHMLLRNYRFNTCASILGLQQVKLKSAHAA
jgi:polysaccharide deacetylase family protein (PEP-CTERM system associated)